MAGETRVVMISVNDVLAGRLPGRAWGVHWADTNWTECRPHLTDPSWAAAMSGQGSDSPVGVVLYGPLVCNACEDAGRQAGQEREYLPSDLGTNAADPETAWTAPFRRRRAE